MSEMTFYDRMLGRFPEPLTPAQEKDLEVYAAYIRERVQQTVVTLLYKDPADFKPVRSITTSVGELPFLFEFSDWGKKYIPGVYHIVEEGQMTSECLLTYEDDAIMERFKHGVML